MIQAKLSDRYEIRNDPPRFGKDMNDELQHFLQRQQRQMRKERDNHVR